MWQQKAEEFEIDGHLPVQELWERARSAWGEILAGEASSGASSILVVAHNAVNQALVATATGEAGSGGTRAVCWAWSGGRECKV